MRGCNSAWGGDVGLDVPGTPELVRSGGKELICEYMAGSGA